MTATDTKMDVTRIPIEDIWADKNFNCRGAIQAIDVMDLAKDIERNGLIMPITVAPLTPEQTTMCVAKEGKPYKYRLIAGYRRHRSFRVLGRNEIDCIVRHDMQDEKKARLFNLSENLHRKELDILQEVEALRPLKELQGLSEADAARELGMSRGWVQIRFMMMSMPEEVCSEIAAYKLTNKQVRNLYSIYGTAGLDSTIKALKKMKDGKIAGRTIQVNANLVDINRPRVRTRSDLLQMLDHLTNCGIPISIHNRCLAWAAGEISSGDLHRSLVDYADEEGHVYHLPADIHEEDLPPN